MQIEVVLDARRGDQLELRAGRAPARSGCGACSAAAPAPAVSIAAARASPSSANSGGRSVTGRRPRAGERDAGRVGVVVGLQHDDLVAGIAQRQQRRGDRLGGPERDQQVLGLKAVLDPLMLAHRLAQRRDPGSGAYWFSPPRSALTAASITDAGPSYPGIPGPG